MSVDRSKLQRATESTETPTPGYLLVDIASKFVLRLQLLYTGLFGGWGGGSGGRGDRPSFTVK